MSSIKIEIIIPIYYNDKTPIEDENFNLIYDTIKEKFSGVNVEVSNIKSQWLDQTTKKYIRDVNRRLWVICEDTEQNRNYFKSLKDPIEKILRQKEILMFITPIELIGHINS